MAQKMKNVGRWAVCTGLLIVLLASPGRAKQSVTKMMDAALSETCKMNLSFLNEIVLKKNFPEDSYFAGLQQDLKTWLNGLTNNGGVVQRGAHTVCDNLRISVMDDESVRTFADAVPTAELKDLNPVTGGLYNKHVKVERQTSAVNMTWEKGQNIDESEFKRNDVFDSLVKKHSLFFVEIDLSEIKGGGLIVAALVPPEGVRETNLTSKRELTLYLNCVALGPSDSVVDDAYPSIPIGQDPHKGLKALKAAMYLIEWQNQRNQVCSEVTEACILPHADQDQMNMPEDLSDMRWKVTLIDANKSLVSIDDNNAYWSFAVADDNDQVASVYVDSGREKVFLLEEKPFGVPTQFTSNSLESLGDVIITVTENDLLPPLSRVFYTTPLSGTMQVETETIQFYRSGAITKAWATTKSHLSGLKEIKDLKEIVDNKIQDIDWTIREALHQIKNAPVEIWGESFNIRFTAGEHGIMTKNVDTIVPTRPVYRTADNHPIPITLHYAEWSDEVEARLFLYMKTLDIEKKTPKYLSDVIIRFIISYV
eukprot:GHVS01044002.1.p1 GENE.GHVS01044002.1~~GHVS01044002.1.p1  ORF type:complete len:537 (+),score=67.06 GHVS01044002.1:44-1654(+)